VEIWKKTDLRKKRLRERVKKVLEDVFHAFYTFDIYLDTSTVLVELASL
jgi:hypothetical protein